jgi:hypothetical protein
MATRLAPTTSLPFELGEARSFGGLIVVPLFASREPTLEYVGLDEADAGGLTVTEIDEAGDVESLLVANPLGTSVLLYEGEELVGAKQNRVLERSILVGAGSKLEIPAKCVEAGRWAYRSRQFAPAPRASHPELRRIRHDVDVPTQQAVWAEVAAKSTRLGVHSDTGAAEAMYTAKSASLDAYLQALPRLDGQSGVIVGIVGELACLDFVSRSDVFAGLYAKLLRGYALSAVEHPLEKPLRRRDLGRFLGELELATRESRPAVGLGEEGVLTEYVVGSELAVEGEVVALSAFPGQTGQP